MGIAGQKPTDFFGLGGALPYSSRFYYFLSGRKGKVRGTARKTGKGSAEEKAASFP